MPVTFVHVILGRPQPRLPVGTSFWIFFSQPSLLPTWPSHLVQQVQSIFASSSSRVLCRGSYELTWSLHSAQSSLPDFWSNSSPGPNTRALFIPCWPKSLSLYINLTRDRLLLQFLQRITEMTRSFAYSFFPRTARPKLLWGGFQNHDEQDRVLVNILFHTEPFTQLATNTHSASGIVIHALYGCTSHSSMTSLQRSNQITRLGTRSNAFRWSTKAMYSVFLTTRNCYCNWLTINMTFVVLRPGMPAKRMPPNPENIISNILIIDLLLSQAAYIKL